ncbi:PepSY-associated TM helix domain-containing protein [Nostoc commune]|uniref:PepSY-associated TM helix domain-containing protein n=1 Tax=Nostoc commune TaxID=1178 RepID=UPI0018C635B8|nr:PepSY-associated TM helix domain-containing protein [Nostoc commune]MBG1263853.1 PepSY domain-containing protein [Nostoc commune BAE]
MSYKKLRNIVLTLHRYIGLAVGLIAIMVGLTGSLLVFQHEIISVQRHQQIGAIAPQGEPLPIERILNTVKSAYANQPDALLQRLYLPAKPDEPFNVVYATKENDWIENYVHPYTGAILGNNLEINAIQRLFKIAYELHYSLLAGDIGLKIVGIVGFLGCVLSITGIILWPGWRKLTAGLKIKWNAHPMRVNFDIHKVAGIVAAVFLVLTFFTGFCWNLGEFTTPLIYTATFSSEQAADPVSKPIPGLAPLKLVEQMKTAQAMLPHASLRSIDFPAKPENALRFRFKLPQEKVEYGNSNVYLDRYSGKVLRLNNALKSSLGDRVLNSFEPLHYGTFGGLSTRILYVFVGFTPLILFITGFVMWRDRRKSATRNHPSKLSVKR